MATLLDDLAALDRLIHEPARLSILTALASVESADFTALQRLTGLTAGNLSSHLSKLEEAQLVKVDKKFVARKPNTLVAITKRGRAGIDFHWKQLERLHRNASDWKTP